MKRWVSIAREQPVRVSLTVQRSVFFLVGGILIGVLIGYTLAPTSKKVTTTAVDGKSASVAGESPAAKSETTSATQKYSATENKVLLGNITTVPFQELYGLLSSQSREEVMKLAQQLRELPPGRETNAKIAVFFKAWAHLDPKAAFTVAASFKTSETKGAAIGAIIDGADSVAASSLAQSINELPADALPSGQRSNFLGRALMKWSQVDAVAAAKFLDASAGGARGLMGARVTIAENWAASDPQAALAWAQTPSDDPSAKYAVSGAIAGWWHTDPRAAEDYVASHLDSVGAETVMALTRQIFGQDPQRAKEWATQLSTVEARRSATTFIAMQLAQSDPKSAGEWVVTLPDDVRERAMYSVMNSWARREPEAVAGWINALSGNRRDEAIGAYSSTLSVRNPTVALTWATSISDEKLRDTSVHRIVTTWMYRSPREATAWIQSSTLPEAEKTRLLATPPAR
ncbi:MAG: hypothetical protein QOH88_1414 [Verrucomicrobiota bacterium]